MNLSRQPAWLRLLIVVIVMAVVYWSRRLPDNTPRSPDTIGDRTPPIEAERPPAEQPPAGEHDNNDARTKAAPRIIVDNVIVKDQQGRVVHRGAVDLSDTIARIQRGVRLDFRNDGAIFENRERRLPREPRGYYREFVHPTPELPGPGPQRVVTGNAGEIYYTHDHYRNFRQLKSSEKIPQR